VFLLRLSHWVGISPNPDVFEVSFVKNPTLVLALDDDVNRRDGVVI